jgi:hypothetical protein
VEWTGLDWTGLDWTGLDWSGLDSSLVDFPILDEVQWSPYGMRRGQKSIAVTPIKKPQPNRLELVLIGSVVVLTGFDRFFLQLVLISLKPVSTGF